MQLKKIKKNDIIYWKGHVALALSRKINSCLWPDEKNCYHGHKTIKKIEKTAKLKVIGIKRL